MPITYIITGTAVVSAPNRPDYLHRFRYIGISSSPGHFAGAMEPTIQADAQNAAGLVGVAEVEVTVKEVTVKDRTERDYAAPFGLDEVAA